MTDEQIIDCGGNYEAHPAAAGDGWMVVNGETGQVHSGPFGREEAVELATELNSEAAESLELRIFDGNPSQSGPCEWPQRYDVPRRDDVPLKHALQDTLHAVNRQAVECGEYQRGDRLWWILFDDAAQLESGSFAIDFD